MEKRADWQAIYERAEQMELEMLERRKAKREAKQKAEASLRGTIGTTTMSNEDSRQD